MLTKRFLRRGVVVLIGLVALGELGTGIAATTHQRAVLAEARAAQAYVEAVKPIAVRLYDAVQPIQDGSEAFGTSRTGVFQAFDDVVLHGGASVELATARKQLLALPVPKTHAATSVALESALDELVTSVKGLRTLVSTRGKSVEGCASCQPFELLAAAMDHWQIAVTTLSPQSAIPAPGDSGGSWTGKRHDTLGGFIHRSSLVCSANARSLALLPHTDAQQEVENFPKAAAILRRAVASLRAVHLPTAQGSLSRQVDARLQGAVSFATTMDKLHRAYHQGNLSGYGAALVTLEEQLPAMDAISASYQARGVTACATFFGVPEKDLKKSYSI